MKLFIEARTDNPSKSVSGFTLADALLGIETFLRLLVWIGKRGFTLADALLGIETRQQSEQHQQGHPSFTLADALLGIET